jgi:hypothetical protein
MLNKFYIFFLVNILSKFVYGYLIKNKNLYLYILARFLHVSLTFFKLNHMIQLQSLIDISVVDMVAMKYNRMRFVLNYVFINFIAEKRIIIKIFTDCINPIKSICIYIIRVIDSNVKLEICMVFVLFFI